ncbi:MAG: sulfur carrier protein ThiS [Chthoniobacterales bacterium]|nr:sulfur carrier protein ThiS [Chthoniobacterales bacterium]
MTFFLNGEGVTRDDAKTVGELILRLELPSTTVLVEHNGVALHQREWGNCVLRENDRVELLRVAAGG